jgi:hypothetical protein
MSTQEDKKLVLTDSGIWMRVFGLLAMLGSLGFFLSKMPEPGKTAFTFAGWIFVICGLGMILFASDLTITANRSTRILQLKYRYWWLFDLTREIPFDDIADVRAVSSTSTDDDGHTSTSYRLETVLKDGHIVPFRWYSFTDSGKKQQAARLRTAIGITHKRKTSAANELFDETSKANY